MRSTLKRPSHVPMWRGVGAAYLLIAWCMYPVAIGGFWAYGNLVKENKDFVFLSTQIHQIFSVLVTLSICLLLLLYLKFLCSEKHFQLARARS